LVGFSDREIRQFNNTYLRLETRIGGGDISRSGRKAGLLA
jgi:hypothetical protein